MLVALPREIDGVSGPENDLANEPLDRRTSNRKEQEVRLSWPTFRMASQFRLIEVLQSPGMRRVF